MESKREGELGVGNFEKQVRGSLAINHSFDFLSAPPLQNNKG